MQEHLTLHEMQDVNVHEMTSEVSAKLREFLTLKQYSLYATYVAVDELTLRPFNMRCLTAD